MLALSENWGRELAGKPETGMGYQIASIILKDGKRFDQVVIVEGIITQVRGIEGVPFIEDQIEEIVLTHDKWDFNAAT